MERYGKKKEEIMVEWRESFFYDFVRKKNRILGKRKEEKSMRKENPEKRIQKREGGMRRIL